MRVSRQPWLGELHDGDPQRDVPGAAPEALTGQDPPGAAAPHDAVYLPWQHRRPVVSWLWVGLAVVLAGSSAGVVLAASHQHLFSQPRTVVPFVPGAVPAPEAGTAGALTPPATQPAPQPVTQPSGTGPAAGTAQAIAGSQVTAAGTARRQPSTPAAPPTAPQPQPTTSSPQPGPYAQAVLASQPDAYWRFSDPPGATSYADSSGNGDSLPAGLTTLVTVAGQPGAISTARGGTYTQQPLSALEGDAPRTLELWFATTAGGCLLTAGSSGDSLAFSLCLVPGPDDSPAPGVPGLYLRTSDADVFVPDAGLTDANWHYLAVTLSGATVQIVIDGGQPGGYVWDGTSYGDLSSQPFTLPATPDTAASPLGIATAGLGGHGSGFDGLIDELAIYPAALPAADLAGHYQIVAPGTSPP